MQFGLGLMGYHGCWEDAAFAEAHGFASAGFVDSPLLGGETFACMALAAGTTTRLRLGSLLAIPSSRSAPTTAQGIATVNRLAPGRTFLALGTGFTSRSTFGLPPIPTAALAAFARSAGAFSTEARSRTRGSLSASASARATTSSSSIALRVYIGADAPKALRVAGEVGDGWVCSLMFANVMENAAEVFAELVRDVKDAARAAGRNLDGAEAIWSTTLCVLEPGERPTDPRVLERVGAHAMMPFHAYADNPGSAEFLPPQIQKRLPIYQSEVLDRLGVGPERSPPGNPPGPPLPPARRRGTGAHRRDRPHDDADRQRRGDRRAAPRARGGGLTNISIWFPPRTTRDGVRDVAEKIMPLL